MEREELWGIFRRIFWAVAADPTLCLRDYELCPLPPAAIRLIRAIDRLDLDEAFLCGYWWLATRI